MSIKFLVFGGGGVGISGAGIFLILGFLGMLMWGHC